MYIYLSIYIYIIKVYVCMYVRMYVHAYVYASVYMSRHPRNSPPKPGFRLSTGSGGTTHNTWNHKTRNHRVPSPSPPLRHTDENDGDAVVHNDVDVLFPVWLLVVPLLLCCSGLRHCMFTALFSCKPCLACDVLAKTVLTVVIPSQVSVKVSLNT